MTKWIPWQERKQIMCSISRGPLTHFLDVEKNGEITFTIACADCDEDEYAGLTIHTGLKVKDLKKFAKPLKAPIVKEMKIT